jgi:hypothetical protein
MHIMRNSLMTVTPEDIGVAPFRETES